MNSDRILQGVHLVEVSGLARVDQHAQAHQYIARADRGLVVGVATRAVDNRMHVVIFVDHDH